MGSRPADGDYARFVEATLGLADAAAELPRRARFGMTVALLTACESDRVARTALMEHDTRRIEEAAAELRNARASLAAASHDTAVELRRRRALSRV